MTERAVGRVGGCSHLEALAQNLSAEYSMKLPIKSSGKSCKWQQEGEATLLRLLLPLLLTAVCCCILILSYLHPSTRTPTTTNPAPWHCGGILASFCIHTKHQFPPAAAVAAAALMLLQVVAVVIVAVPTIN